MAEVIEQVVLASRHLGKLVHGRLRDAGDGRVVGIYSFTHLEIDIRVLGRAAEDGMLGGQGTCPVGANSAHRRRADGALHL